MTCHRTIKHKNPEIKPVRKIVRLVGLLFPLSYYWWGRDVGLWVTGVVLVITFGIDMIRLTNAHVNSAILKALSFFVKKKEEHSISTTTALLISLFVSILLFDPAIVLVTSILFIVSDAVAEIYGKSYGKHQLYGRKTVEGTAAGLMSNVLLAIGLYSIFSFSFLFLLGAGVLVTLGELVSTRIDDNLSTIAVVSFILHAILYGIPFVS